MVTNQDRAIQELDQYKPRALGAGIATSTLEAIAADPQSTVRPDFRVMDMTEQEWKKMAKKQTVTLVAITGGLIVSAILLLKYGVIKL